MLMETVLESHWVLERTDIGQAEIAHRALKLPMTARAILLMVDGKSEIKQLQRKMAGLPEAMNILESMLSNGLIRRRHYSSDTSIRDASHGLAVSQQATQQALKQAALPSVMQVVSKPTAPTPVVGKQRKSLALARLYLLDQMERMFGDSSDAARNLLRTATTRDELLSVFADCREILLETTGAERTQRIEQEFLAMLPDPVAG